MKLFRSRRFDASPRHRKIYSALFLDEATVKAGTWLFIIGSVFFAGRPAVRLARELHLAGLGEGPQQETGETSTAGTGSGS
jgi:hypothetical protein